MRETTAFKPVLVFIIKNVNKKEKWRIVTSLLAQITLALFDLIGVALSGVLAYLAVNQSQRVISDASQNSLALLLTNLNLQDMTIKSLVIMIVTLIIFKDVVSILVMNRLFRKLQELANDLSEKFVTNLFQKKWLWMKKTSPEDLTYSLTEGANALTVGIIGNIVLILSELCVLVFLVIVLGFVDVWMVTFALCFFGLTGYFIGAVYGRRVRNLGNALSESTLSTRTTLVDIRNVFREIRISSRESLFRERFIQSRFRSTKAFTEAEVLQQLPKYVLEIAGLLGLSCLYLISEVTSSSELAIQKTLVYFVASARIIPSLLRLQSYWLSLHRSIGYSSRALEIITEIQEIESKVIPLDENDYTASVKNKNSIIFKDVTFTYPDSTVPVFNDFSFVINRFDRVAIIGESGSGKSTFCDLISGSIAPDNGFVRIFGHDLNGNTKSISEQVVFLPQGSQLIRGTILENVTLELGSDDDQLERAKSALSNASIWNFVITLPNGIHTIIGENGLKLSGGQEQRILIARSFYANPNLLIYDEPTSSLDSQNTMYFDQYLESLRDKVTIIYITHKEPNRMLFDFVYKLEGGQLRMM